MPLPIFHGTIHPVTAPPRVATRTHPLDAWERAMIDDPPAPPEPVPSLLVIAAMWAIPGLLFWTGMLYWIFW